MRKSRPSWQDVNLTDLPAPLPRLALLPLACGLVVTAILTAVHPDGWVAGLETGTVIMVPVTTALTLMFGGWNLRGPSRRNWDWAVRYRRRRQRTDLRTVHAKGRIALVGGELAAVADGAVIPARPGSSPLPPPGVYHLTWHQPSHAEDQPLLLAARPSRAGARWLALIGAVLFGTATLCMLVLFRHTVPPRSGGDFALAFWLLLMTSGVAIPAWLLTAEWRYLSRRPDLTR